MSEILSRDAILDAEDRRFVDVEVPEWGGTVRLASLRADRFFEYVELKDDPTRPFWLLAHAIVGEDGDPLFGKEDIAALQAKNPAAILRLIDEAGRMNVLTPRAAEEQRGN